MPHPPFTDLDFVHQNRLPVDAVGFGYDTVGDARNSVVSRRYLCLDGGWDFLFYPSLDRVPEGIEFIRDFPSDYVVNIPHEWNSCERVGMAFDAEPEPSKRILNDNAVGVYHRIINITTEMLERELFLQLNGVGSAAEIYVGGSYIGFCQSSYDPHRFNIADFVLPGENHITIIVYRFSYGSCFEDLDCDDTPRLAGIFRSVWLCGEPIFRIDSLCVNTRLENSYTDATLMIKAGLNAGAELDSLELWGILYDAGGNIVGKAQELLLNVVRTENSVELELEISPVGVNLWSDESPYLYRLVLYLQDTFGNSLDLRSTYVGFREVAVSSDGGLKLNGQPVKLFGTNYTEWDAYLARAVEEEQVKEIVYLLKRCNINAVRLLKPACELFYDLCDRVGILVVERVSFEVERKIFNHVQLANFCRERLLSLYLRLKNHPCLILWQLDEMPPRSRSELVDLLEARDGTRPIVGVAIRTLETPSSRHIKKAVKLNDAPLLLDCVGGRSTNGMTHLADYVEAMRGNEHIVGVFLFNYIEQALFNGSKPMYFGRGGILRADYTPYPTAFEIKQCFSSLNLKLDGELATVYNNHAFKVLSDYSLNWELRLDGLSRQSGRIQLERMKPGESQKFIIPYTPIGTEKSSDLVVAILDNNRYEWCEPQRNVCTSYTRLKDRSESFDHDTIAPSETAEHIVFQKGDVCFKIDRYSGLLSGVKLNGFEFLSSPMRPQFSRVDNDNDRCLHLPPAMKRVLKAGFWEQAERSLSLTEIKRDGDKVRTVFAAGGMKKLFIEYSCNRQGELTVELVATTAYDLQRLGMTFEGAPSLCDLATFCLGPGENYVDRRSAATPILIHGDKDELCTDYATAQDNGNRHGAQWLMLVGRQNNRSHMMLIRPYDKPFDLSITPYTKEQLRQTSVEKPLLSSERMTINMDAVNSGIGEELTPAVYVKNPNNAPAGEYKLKINIQITEK